MVRLSDYRPKGEDFVRVAIARALALATPHGGAQAKEIVAGRYGQDSLALQVMGRLAVKAPLSALGSGDFDEPDGWTGASANFVAGVEEMSVLGALAGARRLPLDMAVGSVVGGASAAWVPDGGAIPLSSAIILGDALTPRKVASLVAVSAHWLLRGGPEIEAVLRRDMLRSMADAVDEALLDPTNDSSGDAPMSITYGAPSTAATASIDDDLAQMVSEFQGDLTRAVWIMEPATAVRLSSADRPNVGMRGGELLGAPVAVSRRSPGGQIALVDPGGLAVAPGFADTFSSRQASIEMVTDPTIDASGANPTEANLVSMFQTNSVAIRTVLSASWDVLIPGSVSVLTGAAS
jgi:hypothetical protein